MRIDRLHINGFGLFHQLTITDLSSHVTIFLGHNESGKSTLLGFIRAILFGFPDGRTNENIYPPLAGGRHGGNITLQGDEDEIYIVERYPGPGGGKVDVLNPDHTHGGKEILTNLLGTDNRTLFKHIYAFSLSELQYFESLNTESVRETLYSAGAGIDPRGLANLKSALEKKDADLFKPGGNKPKINNLIVRLTTIQKEKKTLQGAVDEYDRIKAQISRLSHDINELEKKRVAVSLQLKKTENWIDIQPEWVSLTAAKEKLQALEPIDSFPLQGIIRLDGLYSRIEDLQRERLTKIDELRRQESELPNLTKDLDILKHASSIRQLQKDQGRFEAVMQEIFSLKQDIANSEQKLRQDLNRLGPSWSEKQVIDFDLSIAAREKVRYFRGALDQIRFEEQRKQDSLETAYSGKKDAEEKIGLLNEPSIKDDVILHKLKGSCQELGSLLMQDRLANDENRYLGERLKDLEDEKNILTETPFQEKAKWPFRITIGSWGIGVLLLFGFGIHMEMEWLYSAAVLLLILGVVLWSIKVRTTKNDLKKDTMIKSRSLTLASKIDDLQRKKDEVQVKMAHIEEQMASLRTILSLTETPSSLLLDKMEQDFTEQMTQLVRRNEALKNMELAEKRYNEALEAVQHTNLEANSSRHSWLTWLKDRNLDPALSPEGALETFSLIEACKEQIKNLEQLRSKIEALYTVKSQYLSLAEELFEIDNRRPTTDNEAQLAIQDLIQVFVESEKASQKRELLLKEIQASRESMDRLDGLINKLQEEIQGLMDSGGAENDDIFRKRAQIFEERTLLKKDVQTYEDRIKRLSGKWGGMESVKVELLKVNTEDLEAQRMALERELNEIESALEKAKQDKARFDEQIRQLVNDERISALRAEEESLKEELTLLTEEWIIVKMAQGLIKMAGARYEKERQPRVISEAGRFFKQLTLGRYPSIVAPIGEDRIEVMCQDNSRKEIGHLSRGTAEQLYLSLRFGFISEFSKRSGSLPIIMDEILVNFDTNRAKAAVESIVDLSREHQIFYFTCHPMTAELFKQADPGIPIIEISQGDVKDTEDATLFQPRGV